MRRIIAQAKKELRQISRKGSLSINAFVLPAFLLVLLGSGDFVDGDEFADCCARLGCDFALAEIRRGFPHFAS